MKGRRQHALAGALLAALLFAAPGAAQEPAEKPCEQPEHRQFDFWLGEWDVLTPEGHQAGTNRIEKILNGCALLENWTSTRGGTGKSLNFFNTATRRWEQVWVASSGGAIKYQGEFKDGAMHFDEGEQVRPAAAPRSLPLDVHPAGA